MLDPLTFSTSTKDQQRCTVNGFVDSISELISDENTTHPLAAQARAIVEEVTSFLLDDLRVGIFVSLHLLFEPRLEPRLEPRAEPQVEPLVEHHPQVVIQQSIHTVQSTISRIQRLPTIIRHRASIHYHTS